ncbi:hypothetical protein NAT51_13935 [Flavobacterium amniphilum]|uniref:hypothetical protein n=1 Tax=Flavobacterium amniphilum TaxID=1834035 RepID=UPI002029C382|nr:hypothetical protein [Flavobacterium amniphilum]MCL9806631.1 hypothetical protein [Flavobacterium amniphilum]
MSQNFLNGKTTMYFLVFAGLSPLAFYFSQNGLIFLISSSFAYIAWSLLLVAFYLLGTESSLNKKQLLALAIFYSCLPFSSYFSEKHTEFVLLNQSPLTAIVIWILAIVVLIKFFRSKDKLKQIKFHDNKA